MALRNENAASFGGRDDPAVRDEPLADVRSATLGVLGGSPFVHQKLKPVTHSKSQYLTIRIIPLSTSSHAPVGPAVPVDHTSRS
jgi:hypothetical protein